MARAVQRGQRRTRSRALGRSRCGSRCNQRWWLARTRRAHLPRTGQTRIERAASLPATDENARTRACLAVHPRRCAGGGAQVAVRMRRVRGPQSMCARRTDAAAIANASLDGESDRRPASEARAGRLEVCLATPWYGNDLLARTCTRALKLERRRVSIKLKEGL